MANYSATLTTELAAGQTQTLSDAALTGSFTTQAVSLGRDAGQPQEIVLYNHSAVVATVQVSEDDVDGDYQAFKVDGTAVTVAATTSQQFRCIARFLRVSMASDPGTGKVIVGR